MLGRSFYSKILLFGEYSVIIQSKALTIPYHEFSGELAFPSSGKDCLDRAHERQDLKALKSFALYIQDYFSRENKLSFDFDLDAFLFDLDQGLYFSSTIPQGVGAGSSGALCAAIWHRYGRVLSGNSEHNLPLLKSIFSVLESHFHGESSGLDPLVSYLNRPLLVGNDGNIDTVTLSTSENEGEGMVFLLDTGKPRTTGPLVELFLEKCGNPSFMKLCKEEFIPTTNNVIDSFLDKNVSSLWEGFQRLSLFQFENMRAMIPNYILPLWKKGLETRDFSLKVCGAGGGGLFIGITKDKSKVKEYFKDYHLRKLFLI